MLFFSPFSSFLCSASCSAWSPAQRSISIPSTQQHGPTLSYLLSHIQCDVLWRFASTPSLSLPSIQRQGNNPLGANDISPVVVVVVVFISLSWLSPAGNSLKHHTDCCPSQHGALFSPTRSLRKDHQSTATKFHPVFSSFFYSSFFFGDVITTSSQDLAGTR